MDLEDKYGNQNYPNIFILLKNGERVEVDGRFRNISMLIHDMAEGSQGEDIMISSLTQEMLLPVLDYCKRHNWNPPKIKIPLASNSLQQNLSEQDYLFIKDYQVFNKDTKLKDLINTANILQMQSLYDLAICRISTEFYFGNDLSSFDDHKKRHNITEDLTIETEEKIHKDYPWI